MQWNADDDPESPAPSATPVIPWQTPWSNNNTQTPSHEPTPRTDGSGQRQPAASSPRQDALQRERERDRSQRHRQRQEHHHHQQRQITLELLEARSINRALDQEVAALKAELQDVKAAMEISRGEERRLSVALNEKASLLAAEKSRRREVETELNRCKSALTAAAAAVGGGLGVPGGTGDGNTTGKSVEEGSAAAAASAGGATADDDNDDEGCSTSSTDGLSHSLSGSTSNGSTSGSSINNSSSASSSGGNPDGSRSIHLDPSSAAGSVGDGSDDGPGIPDLLECTKLSLTGTVRVWVDGMQAACSPGLRQALVLPWLLHKLFYLCSELISLRHEEVLNVFVGGVVEGAGEEETAYMDRHLRRHYPTVFPLSGERLAAAIHNVMMALAHSMIDSAEWNPSVKDPEAVQAALTASGLEKIVEEYLNIAVLCCLQHLQFTDDLGEVEPFSPEKHALLSGTDREKTGEACIIIFPAFVSPGGGGGGGGGGSVGRAGGANDEGQIIGKRYVLSHEAR